VSVAVLFEAIRIYSCRARRNNHLRWVEFIVVKYIPVLERKVKFEQTSERK
jgi:hypothetical protein